MPQSSERRRIDDPLARQLASLGVQESDLEESFVRSSGPGGQNVNKTATCVLLHHRPTGLRIKAQTSRQQAVNRTLARRILVRKLQAARNEAHAQEAARRARIRRQQRTRSPAVKERVLATKAHHAAKKRLRRELPTD